MRRVDDIPIHFALDRVRRELHLPEEKIPASDLGDLIESAESLIHARAALVMAYVEEHGPLSVTLAGLTFTSKVLAAKLKDVERAFPYLITIGNALEDRAATSGDLLRQFTLEGLGDMALRQAREYVTSLLEKRHGLPKISSLSPGSLSDWPITEQVVLFSLFPDGGGIGVRLSESLLMIPRKSISGIFFPTEEDFFSCRICPRPGCPARKADYDKAREDEFR